MNNFLDSIRLFSPDTKTFYASSSHVFGDSNTHIQAVIDFEISHQVQGMSAVKYGLEPAELICMIIYPGKSVPHPAAEPTRRFLDQQFYPVSIGICIPKFIYGICCNGGITLICFKFALFLC